MRKFFFKHLLRLISSMVFFLANHALNATINDEHGAGTTGSHSAIKSWTFQSNAQFGSLTNSVLFRMDGSYTMLSHINIFMVNHLSIDSFLEHIIRDVISSVWQTRSWNYFVRFRYLAFFFTSSPLVPRGGPSSPVKAKWPASRIASKLLPDFIWISPLLKNSAVWLYRYG